MTIRAILFDADGVIQTTSQTFIPRLKTVVEDALQGERFVTEVFAAEKPCLSGKKDFAEELERILNRWNVKAPVKEVLRIWESIEPIYEVTGTIQHIRSRGVGCYLATNQQSYRGTYMRTALNYDALFDGSFYSFELGAAKPEPSYFERAIQKLDLRPSEVLFVDDKEVNVIAAKLSGMEAVQFDARSFHNPGQSLSAAVTAYGVDLR